MKTMDNATYYLQAGLWALLGALLLSGVIVASYTVESWLEDRKRDREELAEWRKFEAARQKIKQAADSVSDL